MSDRGGNWAVLDLLGADAVDAAGAVGVDEGVGVLHFDGAAGCGDAEFRGVVGGRSGSNFDLGSEGREAVMLDIDCVNAVWDALDGRRAGFVGGIRFAELVHFACYSDRCADGETGRVRDLKAQVAGVALTECGAGHEPCEYD